MMPSVFIEGCINIVVILYTYHCIVAWGPIGEKKQMQRTHTQSLCAVLQCWLLKGIANCACL